MRVTCLVGVVVVFGLCCLLGLTSWVCGFWVCFELIVFSLGLCFYVVFCCFIANR